MSSADDVEFVPRAGIRNMIADSLATQERMWGSKVAELSERVAEVSERVTVIAGDPRIPNSGMLQHIIDKIDDHMKLQHSWRADDVQWRRSQEQEIEATRKLVDATAAEAASIRKHQIEMKQRLQLLAGLLMVARAFKVVVEGVVESADKGRKIYAAVAAISSFLVLLWSFLHSILPAIKYSIAHHKISF